MQVVGEVVSLFKGSIDLTEADNWFREIEKALQAQQVPISQLIKFAAYQLAGETQHWWQGAHYLLQQRNRDEMIIWEHRSSTVAAYTSKLEEYASI
ncbi:hypothetical protein AHAS_Ahas02G0172300 [Arachis hypogaea]